MDHFTLLQLSTKREKETTTEIKCEPAQMAAADLLPNKSHATVNIDLLARLQKLSTATLKGLVQDTKSLLHTVYYPADQTYIFFVML